MTVTELSAIAFSLLLVGVAGWRAADDAARPKLVLVQADWTCRRSHAEPYLRVTPTADEGTDRTLMPVMICDSWSRR